MSKTVTIVGQGYVGLPLAHRASEVGWKVNGLDVSEYTVNRLNAGESHIDDISNEQMQEMIDAGYTATVNSAVIRNLMW